MRAIVKLIWSTKTIFILFYFLFLRERGREGERKGEEHWLLPSINTRQWTCNPSMCPDWWPFGLQDNIQPTKPHQPGCTKTILFKNIQILGFSFLGYIHTAFYFDCFFTKNDTIFIFIKIVLIERETDRHWFIVSLIYAFTVWFLYVPWPRIEPTTLAHRDDALTN